MALRGNDVKKTFRFGFDARTSRGRMHDKTSWFIRLWHDNDPTIVGIGECGPLPGLSPDAQPGFEAVLSTVLQEINERQFSPGDEVSELVPAGFPSITFGLETALLDLRHGGRRIIFDNPFVTGNPLPINGLIWMGNRDFMIRQIDEKIAQGFTCIKLKVGGLDFDHECNILQYIRDRYAGNITLRLDANGAFKPETALDKLNTLARFDIHSIEQPVQPGLEILPELCLKSPIAIALDEELIDVSPDFASRQSLLTRVKPQFLVLKPTLHGGFSGCAGWIAAAEQNGIGWWITSALESNIGLNAICQFTASYSIRMPQGLGTGMIYMDNIPSPLVAGNGQICYEQNLPWDTGMLLP
ncbi:MAG TPA: o-succinylbenzoate synthase [Ohtaekwangia sp.]|nr:o-succinylbenzoate synthase [Ohtaekwangia sp.]